MNKTERELTIAVNELRRYFLEQRLDICNLFMMVCEGFLHNPENTPESQKDLEKLLNHRRQIGLETIAHLEKLNDGRDQETAYHLRQLKELFTMDPSDLRSPIQ